MAAISTALLDIPPGVWTDLTESAAGKRWVGADKMRFRDGLPQTIGGWEEYFSTAFTGVPRTVTTWAELDGTVNTIVGTHKKVELLQGGVKYDVTPLRATVTGALAGNPFATSNGDETVTVTHVAHGLAVGDVVWFTASTVTAFNGVDMADYSWAVDTVPTADSYTIEYIGAATGTGSGGGAAVTFNYTASTMANNPFSTASGSPTVSVTWASHGFSAGQFVVFSGASTFNGVTMNGTWEIASVSDVNTFTITYTSNASGGGAGGGASVRASALLATGSATGASMRIWPFAKWGEDMLMAATPDGNIFLWDASLGPSVRARLLPKAPTVDWILVAPEEQFVNAYGVNSDNMAQAWCSQADLTQWDATSTNSAGTKQYISGSRIVGAKATQREIVVITDVMAYSQQFVGGTDVYSFTPLGQTSLAGPLGIAERGGRLWWMGRNQFYRYSGGAIEVIPCSMWRYVFKDIKESEMRGVVAGVFDAFSEVCFWYTRATATYNDAYAKLNYGEADNVWDPGTIPRTAWQDGGIITNPLGADSDGYLYEHEVGVSANGEPLDAYIISGDLSKFDENGRQVIQYVSMVEFDAVMEGNYDLYIRHKRYRKSDYTIKGPWRITSDVTKLRPRVRNKYIAFEFQTPRISFLEIAAEDDVLLAREEGGTIMTETEARDVTEDLLTFWRLGLPTVHSQNDGYR